MELKFEVFINVGDRFQRGFKQVRPIPIFGTVQYGFWELIAVRNWFTDEPNIYGVVNVKKVPAVVVVGSKVRRNIICAHAISRLTHTRKLLGITGTKIRPSRRAASAVLFRNFQYCTLLERVRKGGVIVSLLQLYS